MRTMIRPASALARSLPIPPHVADRPKVHESAFVAPMCVLSGRVTLGKGSSVWYGSVLRADLNSIEVGEDSNIQDGTIIHVDRANATSIGPRCTIGHGAVLHGCTLEEGVLVGMRATVLSGARVGRGSVIAAGAVVREKDNIPPGSVVVGIPCKVVKTMPVADAIDAADVRAASYATLALRTAEELKAGSGAVEVNVVHLPSPL